MLLLTATNAVAQEIPAVRLQAGEAIDLVRNAAKFYGDPPAQADPAWPSVLAKAAAVTRPNPPPWPDYRILWLAIRLNNPPGASTSDWMLRMDTDPLYLPQAILLDGDRVVQDSRRDDARSALPDTGAVIAVGQRFPLTIPPGEERLLLLRVSALTFDSLVADIVSREYWTDWATHRQAIVAFALALIAASGLYTVVIGSGIGRTPFLWYGLHAGSVLIFWLNYYGILADLFGFTDHDRIVYKAASTAAIGVGPMLTRALLDVPRYAPRLSHALLLCGLAGFALLLPIFVLWPWPELQRSWVRGPDWQYLLALISHVPMITAAILALRHMGIVAVCYLVGWSVYIGATLLTLAAYYGAMPFSGGLLLAAFLCASWEALLVAQALAARIKRLNEEKIAAEAQRKAQQDFLAAISHDLRTPLNAILGATGLPEDSNSSDNAKQRMDVIRRAAKILLALISDLLDRASLSSGNLTILNRSIMLRDCIAEAVELVRDRADEKHLRLRLNIDPALPEWIHGDELRLKQILFNLVENAVKFTQQGEISVAAASPDANRLMITVSDSGPGIAADEQELIFAPYRRGGTQEGHGGSSRGLGLSIARDLSRAMGGDITVESAPGQGSRFNLLLPLIPAAAADPKMGSQIILLVDDVALNRETGAALLRSEGHVVRSCDGLEALEHIERGMLDVVMLDLQMPEIDGFALVQRIRSLPDETKANIPIIVLTAAIDTASQQRLAALGVFDILLKPLSIQSLRQALQHALEGGGRSINYALQARLAREIGNADWSVALQRFREASGALFQELGAATPAVRAELLHRLAGMAAAVGLDAVAQQAAALEQRQRSGESVLDALADLRDQWSRSLQRCLP